jgi:arylsulfatase A
MKNISATILVLNMITVPPILGNSQINTMRKPNIVLIMADDMGYETVGANGCIEYETPNIDRLASSGIRFKHCYSQALCTPSRVKIMTGKYNFRNYEDFGYLNPNQKTFGNLLKEAGYATCIAGKWQLNGLNRNNPGNQDVSRPNHFGFDEYCLWQLHHKRSEGERYANPLLTQNGEDLPRDKNAYGPQVMVDFLSDFIDRKVGTPFFIYYPMVLPHDPFVPTPDSPEWVDHSRRYENDTIYFKDMIQYLDKIVGQLEAKLKEKGVWNNTLFIFTADNGTHRSVLTHTSNGIVTGGKGLTLNTGNHVPMIVTWPEKIKGYKVFHGIIDFTDILPTLADVAGINPSSYDTDGMSLLNVLINDSQKRDKKEVIIHYTPRWGNAIHDRWVMNGKYKMYRDFRFYNTIADPSEKSPLSELNDKEKELHQKYRNILLDKEQAFPFHWNDKTFNPAY